MKPNVNIWNLALVGLLAVVGLNVLHPQAQAAAQPNVIAERACDNSGAVHVSGAAVVMVTPDRALLQLGVQSNGTTPDSVRIDNETAIKKVFHA